MALSLPALRAACAHGHAGARLIAGEENASGPLCRYVPAQRGRHRVLGRSSPMSPVWDGDAGIP